MGLFERSSRQHEHEDKVRIDLTEEEYTWLMRSIERDDAGSIKACVKARLEKDEKGYFLRLPYPEARLLLDALRALYNKVSNEVLQVLPDALAAMKEQTEKEPAQVTETEDALDKFLAMNEEKSDLQFLIEVFFYQFCPEEYHPFGPR